MANSAVGALEELMKSKGITPKEEKKEAKKPAAKKEAPKKSVAKDTKKPVKKEAPTKATTKTPAKKSEKPATKPAAKASAPVAKPAAAPAPKKSVEASATPKVEVVKEDAPAVKEAPRTKLKPGPKPKGEDKRDVCTIAYFTKEQSRLIRAAAESKKISVSQYLYDLTMADLDENGAVYEEVAVLLDKIASFGK